LNVQGRKSTRKSESWRAVILEQAARLFDEVGYQAATMDDLAEAVGLAKPSLYYYFRSKEEILHEISLAMIRTLIARIESRAGLTPSQRILEAMADVLEAIESDPGRMRVLVEHTRDLAPTQREAVMEQRERYRLLLEGMITDAVEAGEMRPLDAALTARAVFGMCNWAYHWLRPDSPYRPREIAYVFWDIVHSGLRPRVP
jgi:AcrR family transcriptional regulator